MKTSSEIVAKSAEFVKSVFERDECRHLAYHNWEHTKNVHNVAVKIGQEESLEPEALENLELAAVFHDVAYFKGKEGHEANSSAMANDFLSKHGFSKKRFKEVERIILATKMGTQANDLLEQIIQDADASHLGSDRYFERTFKDLLQEINSGDQPSIPLQQWEDMCAEFMTGHAYHTNYAKTNFEHQKRKNIARLKEMSSEGKELGGEHPAQESSNLIQSKKEKKKKKKKKAKKSKDKEAPEKGIETMFRVALRNHVSLSRIADNKANTLISVNAIIISIVLSTMFPKMDTNPYIIFPGLGLIVFSIVTIIISILSTIPTTTHGKLSRKEVEERKGNLIFFGNFHKMSLEDYEWGIGELMKDKDYLYKSLTRDLYFLGKVLNRKYMLLRYSYYIFVAGLIVSIILFAVNLQGIVQ